ncbi:glycosyl hydrolase [Paenibacillus sp. BC26]|uniref:glycosyl hydrolase n=1 Tax=Paenibacillus sp. BC26 TaxID=1881032 RepID=UPI0008E2DBF4|nr:glycosyl hydrolase [Paenibacillus sp. BC26]SFT06605.1 alpha-L-rhamnosidase [Paenibacillus sp. BC26]
MQTTTTRNASGFPSRSPELDVYPGFAHPPQGYGEVAFYWWQGETLTKERLEWQLEQLKDHHITSLQINYAHSDKGGASWGLTYESDPPLFSEAWWELFAWFADKAGTCGISVSLSDYTLGWLGQGWYSDEIVAARPDVSGTNLSCVDWPAKDGVNAWDLPERTIAITAYRRGEEGIDLLSFADGSKLRWQKPEGEWNIAVVYFDPKPQSIDPMHPDSGALVIAHFFQRFEDRLKGVPNAKLGFFFSDELEFGIKGKLWNENFRKAFMQRKGYDIVPELAGLFVDIGPRTPKIRLDYGDVMVALSEENYFKPVFDWHDERGMIFGCDHGGRGKDITEFGDYFRTQRWNHGPGCDQPRLECDLIKNKVASSIAHLYERPRTWLEGFYASGWGTTTAGLTDAIFKNYVSGHNLLTLHGLYYTTIGGWWEWAPPCNHFRMPYWAHMKTLLACTERLSYLLSQGTHVCDVAVLYPVEAMEAGLDGEASVEAAFGIGEYLYKQGIDFDFIDFQSLGRAELRDRALHVAGETYRVLILPAMRAVRHSTLKKALAFHEAGGTIIALDRLPEASDRSGAADPVLDEEVKALFGWSAADAKSVSASRTHKNAAGGTAHTVRSFAAAAEVISHAFPRDFACSSVFTGDEFPYVMHRRIGNRDVYALYGIPEGGECFFRCQGHAQLWNPWDGSAEPIQAERITGEGTYLLLPLGRHQMQLVVFDHSDQERVPALTDADNHDAEQQTIELDGSWQFRLLPTMDNRFGDFRQPPESSFIGAEARQFRFAWASRTAAKDWTSPLFDDTGWRRATHGTGPYLWKTGPLPIEHCSEELEALLATMSEAPTDGVVRAGDVELIWNTVEFSTRYGIEGDAGHQGYHGLKAEMSDDFIVLGKPAYTMTDTRYEPEDAGTVTYLWSTFDAGSETSGRLRMGGMLPAKLWLNGRAVENEADIVMVRQGMNAVLMRYDCTGRGHVVFERTDFIEVGGNRLPLAMSWHNNPNMFAYDAFPGSVDRSSGCYRFTAPPGLEALDFNVHGAVRVWVDGMEYQAAHAGTGNDGSTRYQITLHDRISGVSVVAIQVHYDKACYAGAAVPEPIKLRCGDGMISAGDWSTIDGLTCYSGGAVYRKTFNWRSPKHPKQAKVSLDLGDVSATAEMIINGKPVRTLVAPPWKADISEWMQPGENAIEVAVYNTLANHYVTIPTRYRGELTSGLLGPVRLTYDRDEE